MPNKSITVTLDKSDLATILAALRCFQEKYENWNAKAIREDWPDHFEGVKPLGTEDISELCERINTAGQLRLPERYGPGYPKSKSNPGGYEKK
jgi:hypothetical protein